MVRFTYISLLVLFSIFLRTDIHAQCPVVDFSINSPVCAGSPLDIQNLTTGASRYEWDFAPGYFTQQSTIVSDTLLPLNYPGDITAMVENDTNIIFLCGKGNGKLYRLIYGNGPGSPLTQYEDLGNFGGALYQPSDVTFFRQDGEWYGFVVDYGSNSLIRFHLGNSLRNTPDSVVTLLNNSNSNLNAPWSIRIVKDDVGDIHALSGNYISGTLTYFSFGNNIRNTPVPAAPVAVTGTPNVLDMELVLDCGNYYAFIAGYNSGKIIRADFGNSLSNAPTFSNVVNNGSPSDIVLLNDSSTWKLIYTNYASHDLMKYDLGSDLSVSNPVFYGSETFTGNNPKGIAAIRENNNMYLAVLNTGSNRVKMLRYANPTIASNYTDTNQTPSGIYFTGPGSFPVTLKAYDPIGNFDTKTLQITVVPSPAAGFNFQNLCHGDTTAFTDLTTISSGTVNSWSWDFGDSNTSTTHHPTHYFDTAGTYQVKLVATSVAGCSDSITAPVLVSPLPAASFSGPVAVCSLTDLPFVDQSTVSSGSLSAWHWDFGNGDTSALQHPTYSYPMGGSMQVTLTITTAAGCTDAVSSMLNVDDRPQAGFTASNTCVGQSVQFADQTTLSGSSISAYEWTFGDGDTSSLASPAHAYPASVADYTATLIVTAMNGCRDTMNQQIRINNIPVVDFSIQNSVYCHENEIYFNDLSSVSGDTISAWLWDFGDGNSDTTANPVYKYAAPGPYTVTLVAYSPSSCPGPAHQVMINVLESPSASYTHSGVCLGGVTSFTNTSLPAPGSSIASVMWHFTPTDSVAINSPDFQFAASDVYPVMLTVTSVEGCLSSSTDTVTIRQLPQASFGNSLPCRGTPVQFTNTSQADSTSVISQYEWSFGDPGSGAGNFSSSQNPSHTYSSPQTFLVSLITTTNYGCKDTAFKNMTVNVSPPAQFTYSPTCYGDLMEFFNPGSAIDSTYYWSFGDNQYNQLREPAHYYAYPGTYSVTLNVTSLDGCVSTATKQVTVSPIPTADFSVLPACVTVPYQIQDNSTINSGSIVKYKWSITGMAEPDSVANPVVTFYDVGSFPVTLTITSDIGCSTSKTKTISVYDLPVANFITDPQFGNPPLDIQTIDYSQDAVTFSWDFGDGSAIVNDQEPAHTYVDTGMFTMTQWVTSQFGCRDSIEKSIYVIKPVLDIAVTGDSSYIDGDYFHIVARIANLGTRSINSLKMEAELQNGSTISEMNLTPIPNGQAGLQTYTFHASFLISSASNLDYYCIRAMNPNGEADDVPSNNERCFNRTSKLAGMKIYPNPFQDHFSIKLIPPRTEQLTVTLYDQSGKKVETIFDGEAGKYFPTLNYDAASLGEGIYRLSIQYGDESYSVPVVRIQSKN